jgi:hypothetical protein
MKEYLLCLISYKMKVKELVSVDYTEENTEKISGGRYVSWQASLEYRGAYLVFI